MKDFRLTDSSVLNLFGSQEEYKPKVIEAVLAGLPGRRFVLIGDSGEQDPEIYGRIARAHADQVVAVYIRDVTGETPQSGRFAKAFEGIAPGRWRVFKQAQELEPLVSRLAQRRP